MIQLDVRLLSVICDCCGARFPLAYGYNAQIRAESAAAVAELVATTGWATITTDNEGTKHECERCQGLAKTGR